MGKFAYWLCITLIYLAGVTFIYLGYKKALKKNNAMWEATYKDSEDEWKQCLHDIVHHDEEIISRKNDEIERLTEENNDLKEQLEGIKNGI